MGGDGGGGRGLGLNRLEFYVIMFSNVYPTYVFYLFDLFTKIKVHLFSSFSYLEKLFPPPLSNFVLLLVEIKFLNVFCLQIVSVAYIIKAFFVSCLAFTVCVDPGLSLHTSRQASSLSEIKISSKVFQ